MIVTPHKDKAQVGLNWQTAEELKKLHRASATSMFALARIAAELRQAHIDPKTKNYTPEFVAWWTENELEETFGKKANFSKIATAGETILGLEGNNVDEARFPTSGRALYEIGRLPPDKREAVLKNPEIIRPDLKSPELKTILSSFPTRNEKEARYELLAKIEIDSRADQSRIGEIFRRLNLVESDFVGLRITPNQKRKNTGG